MKNKNLFSQKSVSIVIIVVGVILLSVFVWKYYKSKQADTYVVVIGVLALLVYYAAMILALINIQYQSSKIFLGIVYAIMLIFTITDLINLPVIQRLLVIFWWGQLTVRSLPILIGIHLYFGQHAFDSKNLRKIQ